MAVTNALLVRYGGGWTEVTLPASIAAHGRREGMLSVGAIEAKATAEHVARKVLAQLAGPRSSATVGFDPVDVTDTPYFGFDVGDYVIVDAEFAGTASERIRAVTVTEDDDGPIFVPELRDIAAIADARIARWLKGMINGALNGQTNAHSPSPSPGNPGGPGSPARAVMFNGPFPLVASVSVPWQSDIEADLREVTADLLVSGTTDTTGRLLLDGYPLAGTDWVIAAGEFAMASKLYITGIIRTNQRLAAEITAAGAGAAALLIQVRISPR